MQRHKKEVVTKIRQYITTYGLERLSTRKVQRYLGNCLIATPHVSTATIRKHLREDIGVSYRPLAKTNPMYYAPLFDEARYYAARVLSHLLLQGAMIIAIDEASFKTFQEPHRSWQYVGARKRPPRNR